MADFNDQWSTSQSIPVPCRKGLEPPHPGPPRSAPRTETAGSPWALRLDELLYSSEIMSIGPRGKVMKGVTPCQISQNTDKAKSVSPPRSPSSCLRTFRLPCPWPLHQLPFQPCFSPKGFPPIYYPTAALLPPRSVAAPFPPDPAASRANLQGFDLGGLGSPGGGGGGALSARWTNSVSVGCH